MWAELEAEDQTPLVNIRRSLGRFEVPLPLPVMDEPAVYVLHPDVNRPFTVNDVGRPVFVNHYYAGEAFIPVTNKRLIKLDECDVLTEISLRNAQPQDIEREFKEHSQNLGIIQQTAEAEREQRHGNAAVHSDLGEDSQNSLKMTSVSRNTEASQKQSNTNRGIHSEFIEHSQQSLGALNVGKSRCGQQIS